MLKRKVRTIGVLAITIGAAALVTTLSTTAASAATTKASTPGHVTAPAAAEASGCVTQTFSEADENTYEQCVRDEQVLLNNLFTHFILSNLQDIPVDGYYGPETESDVVMFQADFRADGVTIDGITGPQTWWWLCHTNSNAGFTGVYWHDAGCATEPGSPPS